MKLHLLVLLCFVILKLDCYANSDVKDIYTLSKKSIDSSIKEIISKSTDTISSITFTTTIDEYDAFLEPIIVQILQERGIHYLGKLPIKNVVHLRMQIEEFSLKWKTLEQYTDSLEEIGIIRGRIVTSNSSMQSFVALMNTSYSTKVAVVDAKRTKRILPSILVSEIPTSNTSLVEEILTPVLYLGTAVITLLLLFTVRTQ